MYCTYTLQKKGDPFFSVFNLSLRVKKKKRPNGRTCRKPVGSPFSAVPLANVLKVFNGSTSAERREETTKKKREEMCRENWWNWSKWEREGDFFFSSCDGVENNLLLKVALSSHECSVPYILVVYLLLL